MGLEQLNIISNLPLTQGMDGAGVATGAAPQDPLLFLQQLLVQLQGAAGDGQVLTPELQTLLQNSQLPAATADGQNAMDALKAAIAALRSGPAPQGQPSVAAGKPLPPVQAEAGNTLPPEWAALLAESMAAGAVAGEDGADGTALGAGPDKSKAGDESVAEEQGVLSLNQADPQIVPVFLPSTSVAIPPQPVAIAPAPPTNTPVDAKAGDIDASVASANKQALTDHGSAHAERWTEAVGEGLRESVAAPASAADGLAGPASNRGGNSFQGQEQGFANTLATAAGASGPLAAPIEARVAAASAPPPVPTPVGQPGWSQELGDRIVWMTGKSLDSAEIHLNPPHLGPVEVRITMQHDQASIQFVSGHAAVREAIEAAVPRLREMMSDQQLALVDVNVSNQSSQQQFAGRDGSRPQHSQAFAFSERGQGSDKDEARLAETPMAVRTSSGLLNLYA